MVNYETTFIHKYSHKNLILILCTVPSYKNSFPYDDYCKQIFVLNDLFNQRYLFFQY